MKKIVLVLYVLGVSLSCGSSAVVKEARATLNGDWMLNSITYPGSESVEVTLLNDTSAACLENSKWNFVSNNNTGSYVPDKIMCGTQPRFFKWSIDETGVGGFELELKPTDERYQSETDRGFRLDLTNLTERRMVWEQTITFEGEPFTIKMNFTKQNEL